MIVKDLLDNAITIVKERDMKQYGQMISEKTEQKLLQLLMGEQAGSDDESFRQGVLDLLRQGQLEVFSECFAIFLLKLRRMLW